MTSVRPSMRITPKNCSPSLGGRLGVIPGGIAMNVTSGPKVLSRAFGPNVPACIGPATNSQNGRKSVNTARSGLYRCAAA